MIKSCPSRSQSSYASTKFVVIGKTRSILQLSMVYFLHLFVVFRTYIKATQINGMIEVWCFWISFLLSAFVNKGTTLRVQHQGYTQVVHHFLFIDVAKNWLHKPLNSPTSTRFYLMGVPRIIHYLR